MAENSTLITSWVSEVLSRWMSWRRMLYPQDGVAITSEDQFDSNFVRKRDLLRARMSELIERYEAEIPAHSPRYMGHMCSEISLPAIMGHWIALLHNPNNVASEASRVGIQIEKEAISDLLKMVGWNPEVSIGHFTSGGSVANFEAIFRARECFKKLYPNEDGIVIVPRNRHYSWLKACKLMGISESLLVQIELDDHGKCDALDLEKKLNEIEKNNKKVMIVVSVMGSTEFGSIDPVHKVSRVLKRYDETSRPWHHVDAAYGGFLCSIEPSLTGKEDLDLTDLASVIEGLKEVQSITLDPHKLAYVPYACGAFLCRDRVDYYSTQTAAPYLENGSESDRGIFTLEGSRSATGPTATWLTSRSLGFNSDGLGRVLRKTITFRKEFEFEIRRSIPEAYVIDVGTTNILGLIVAKKGEKTSQTNRRSKLLYETFSPTSNGAFIMSKTKINHEDYGKLMNRVISEWQGEQDQDELYVLRFCLMNPFLMSKEMDRKFFQEVTKEISNCVKKEGFN